jgi:hypothetical protein
MATNVELRRSNGTDYNEVIHIATEVSLVRGLLGDDGKLKSELLPSYILGGMRYGGTVDLSSNPNLRDVLASKIHNDNKDEAKGLYFIVSNGGVVETDTGSGTGLLGPGYMISSPGDEGEYVSPVTLETGDWLVYAGYELITDNYVFKFNVVNNTYRNASTDLHGIVRLATEQDGINGTSSIKAMTPKSTVAAINARAYQHPTYTGNDLGSPLTGPRVISDINVNSLGHVTGVSTRPLELADLGFTGDSNANYYVHPDMTGMPLTLSLGSLEHIANIQIDKHGHVKIVNKGGIPTASESGSGVVTLASSSEAKGGTNNSKALTPARAKEMIDKFASIPIVQSLPTNMSDHPAGKLILLQI